MAYKLDMFKQVIPAIDSKEYKFYDKLTVEEKNGFSAFLSLKWGASVSGDQVLQHYYLASMNHHANKHMFDISRHPKLQWLTLVAGSPKFGNQRHTWVSPKAKPVKKSIKDIMTALRKIYPNYRDDEIELLSTLVTKKELSQYNKNLGN